MQRLEQGRGGFLKIIILIVVALIVLGFFGYDIRDIFNSPKIHNNLATFLGWIVTAWNWLVDVFRSLFNR